MIYGLSAYTMTFESNSEKVEEFLELIPKKLKNFWN